jgi:type I restriction enzyme M protein
MIGPCVKVVVTDFQRIKADGIKNIDHPSTFEENEFSKIFSTTDFAYRQVTIERPLRLKFDFTEEKVQELASVFGGEMDKVGMTDFLNSLKGQVFTDRKKLDEYLKTAQKKYSVTKFGAGHYKKIVATVGVRNEQAAVCVDADGSPEPDSELRDYENVPYTTDVYEYFKKEVLPYVADAWVNESVVDHKDGKVGVVGYEIPFTRYFYKYEAPRSLEAIEADIEKVENELLALLKQL